MSRNEIDGLILLLDVGVSMSTKVGSSTYLQNCSDIIQMIAQRRMFQSSKDEISLILFGSRETANILNTNNPDQYNHVNVARPLALVDWTLLDYVQNKISTSNINGDIIDALIVASNHFVEENNKQKVFKDKRIIIFTDFSSTAEDYEDHLDQILHNLKKHDVRIDVISPFSEIDDENESKPNGNHSDEATTSKHSQHNNSFNETKQITKQQKEIQTILRKTCTKTDGSLYSFNEALKVLSIYQAKSIRSAGTKYTMTIGESFKMPIVSLIKCKENKPEIFRFKKVYAKDETVELKIDRTRFTKDDEKRNLDDKADVIDAFRYGSTNVPIDDPESVKLKVEKCFTLLGFTKSDTVKRHYYLSDSVNQIMPDGAGGPEVEEAFVNMVRAMYLEGVYGLVRRVFSSRSSPELGCLIPHIGVDNTCLYYIALPFDDDVRKFKMENFRPKLNPSEKQLDLIDKLIDHMDLMPQNEDDEEEELYDPHTTFSPYIQRMFQAIALRATKPDADIPDFDKNLTSAHSAEIEQRIKTEKTLSLLKRCAEEFPTRVLTKKTKKQDENIFLDKTNIDEINKVNESAIDSKIGLDVMLSSDNRTNVTRIGTITPVDDFKHLAERICVRDDNQIDEMEELCTQMQALIKDLFNESLMQLDDDEHQTVVKLQKVADCIRIQRDYCAKLNMFCTYNTYLKAFKIFLVNFNSNKKYAKQIESFWSKHFNLNLSLISKLECANSDISEEEAKEFIDNFAKYVTDEIETKKEEEENVEDLLDMM